MRRVLSVMCLLAACSVLVPGRSLFAQAAGLAEAKPASGSVKPAVVPTASATDKKLRPLTINVQLVHADTKIVGTLVETTQLLVKTAFGEANIPLSEVAGVRFPTGEDTSTTVVMLNGDSITGASDVKLVTVETEWGAAKINGDSVSSMLFVPGLSWQRGNSISGKRWELAESKPVPATAPGNQPAGQPRTVAPRNQPIGGQSFSGQPF